MKRRSISIRDPSKIYARIEENEIAEFVSSRDYAEIVAGRPRTRGDCVGGPRPCPWISCSQHLYLDVNPETGSIKLNFPDRDFDELRATCALDVADQGPRTLEEVGDFLNITRERARQVDLRARLKMREQLLAIDGGQVFAVSDETTDETTDEMTDETTDETTDEIDDDLSDACAVPVAVVSEHSSPT